MNKRREILVALCPMCGKTHNAPSTKEGVDIKWSGKGTPRLNCKNCIRSMNRLVGHKPRKSNYGAYFPESLLERGLTHEQARSYNISIELEMWRSEQCRL